MKIDISSTPGEGKFWRGDIRMPHMSQILSRDLHGQTVAQNFGSTAWGFMRTDAMVEQCRSGTGPATGMPYRYTIQMPGQYGGAWTAFWGEQDFRAFLAAYAITIESEPEPGKSFKLRLPEDAADWLPVTRSDESAPWDTRA